MKNVRLAICSGIVAAICGESTAADVLGGQFDVNDFYLPFTAADITPEDQQTWPFINNNSMKWGDYLSAPDRRPGCLSQPKGVAAQILRRGIPINGRWPASKAMVYVETSARGAKCQLGV